MIDDSAPGARSDTGPFSLVPEWVLDADISDRAVRLYALLSRYADKGGKAWPSRRTLAGRLKCSVDTVDRAMRQLIDVGAVQVTERYADEGDRTANLYTVVRMQDGGRVDAATGGRMNAAQNDNHVEREGSTATSVSVSRAPGESYDPRKGTKIDGRNLPWDALVEATQADEVAEKGRIAAGLKVIRNLMAEVYEPRLDAAMHESYVAQEIAVRARLYRERWPNVELTPTALAANWSRVMTPQPGRASVDELQRAEQIAQRAIDGREEP